MLETTKHSRLLPKTKNLYYNSIKTSLPFHGDSDIKESSKHSLYILLTASVF